MDRCGESVRFVSAAYTLDCWLPRKERKVTEAAIRQALDKTRVFAERQRLLKELWRVQCASAVEAIEARPQKVAGVIRA